MSETIEISATPQCIRKLLYMSDERIAAYLKWQTGHPVKLSLIRDVRARGPMGRRGRPAKGDA